MKNPNSNGLRISVLFCAALSLAALGCGRLDERLREQADIQSQSSVEAEFGVIDDRVREMEADLERRHRFYQAAAGIYSTVLESDEKAPVEVQVELIPSRWPYPAGRTRTIEEVTEDLTGLHFQVHVTLIAENQIHTSCIFPEVRPDLMTGRIFLLSADCLHTYTLWVAPAELPEATPSEAPSDQLERLSSQLTSQILAGKRTELESLVMESRSRRIRQSRFDTLVKERQR